MRGPIHEAFAAVSVDEPRPNVITSRKVPDPINEIPPDYRPEGENVEWIPGYWSWDEDQEDFIWVSGVWRDIPPGRQWIPGYWVAGDGGNQYISGYWADIEQPETVYLPPPPRPLETHPSSLSSSPDYVWIEGHWVWYYDHYAWQSGYWLEQRPDMVWIPPHYIWTPRGYIFVEGYWDYDLPRRGVMFAPLYYPRPIYRDRGYYYTPSIVLDFDLVFLSLFVRRDHYHYYFGDYHDHRYERRGFRPWYSRNATRYGYDPYYRSYRWHKMRHDRDWENKYHRQYDYRRDHEDARPPHKFRTHVKRNFDSSGVEITPMLGRSLTDAMENRDQPVRFTRLQPDRKREFESQDQKLKELRGERRKLEIGPDKGGRSWKHTDIKEPVRVKKYSSPIKAQSGSNSGRWRFKGKSEDGQDFRSQGGTEGQHELQPQGKPQQRNLDQTDKQSPVYQRGRWQVRPQDQTEEQPQVQPQGKPQQKSLDRTDKQSPAYQRGRWQVRPQDQTEEQPQVQPQGKSQQRNLDQTDKQSPVYQRGRWQVRPQDQTEEQPQVQPQGKPQQRYQDRTDKQSPAYQRGRWQVRPQDQPEEQPRVQQQRKPQLRPQDQNKNQPPVQQQGKQQPKSQKQIDEELRAQQQGAAQQPKTQEQMNQELQDQPQSQPQGKKRWLPGTQSEK